MTQKHIPIFKKIIVEDIVKGRKTKPLTDAILKRHPVTFYYTDSHTDKDPTDRVKQGTRIRGELVALGLSKKGNQLVRGYVEPPSVSKKGYGESGWRTFRVDRMTNIKVLTDEVFNVKRPGYSEGEESKSGPMKVTYVTSKWDNDDVDTQQTDEPTATPPETNNEPTTQPEPERTTEPQPSSTPDLPEPTNLKPSVDPTQDDVDAEVVNNDYQFNFNDLNVRDINGVKTITQQDYEQNLNNVRKHIENKWKENQVNNQKNTNPGQGTRKRFDYDSNLQLSDFLKKNDIRINNELNEMVIKIKRLINYTLHS